MCGAICVRHQKSHGRLRGALADCDSQMCVAGVIAVLLQKPSGALHVFCDATPLQVHGFAHQKDVGLALRQKCIHGIARDFNLLKCLPAQVAKVRHQIRALDRRHVLSLLLMVGSNWQVVAEAFNRRAGMLLFVFSRGVTAIPERPINDVIIEKLEKYKDDFLTLFKLPSIHL